MGRRMYRKSFGARGVALFVLLWWGVCRAGADQALQVTVGEAEIFPGQAVLVTATACRPLASLAGELTDRKVMFFPDESRLRWTALAGVDLAVSAGTHALVYRGRYTDGTPVKGRYDVTVLAKSYPEERITVDRKFVQLSKQDLERVRRERKMLNALYRVQGSEVFWQGGFGVPVNVEAGSRFGLRRFFNNEPRNPHSGSDLKASGGTPVQSPSAGRTVFAGELFFSGNAVILDHGGGLFTLYAHLQDMTVGEGDLVSKGEVIGHVGATGRVTGPHLHWGAKLNGARVDPFSLVLLPLHRVRVVAEDVSARPEDPTDKERVSPSRETRAPE